MAIPDETLIVSQIDAVVTGGAASYSIGSRTVTSLDPEMLYRLAKQIAADNDRATNGMFRLAKMQRTSR